jgi:hypothetical protein
MLYAMIGAYVLILYATVRIGGKIDQDSAMWSAVRQVNDHIKADHGHPADVSAGRNFKVVYRQPRSHTDDIKVFSHYVPAFDMEGKE